MKLKKWFRKNKLTLEKFAAKVGVHVDTVRGWLDGGAVTRRNAMKIEQVTDGKVKADKLPKVKRRFLGRRCLGRKKKGKSNANGNQLRAI